MQINDRTIVPKPNSYIEFPMDRIENTISELFVQQARKKPDAIAFRSKNYNLTYNELHKWSNSIMSQILNVCGKQGKFISLVLEHDAPMIAAMLGVWKSGNAFVVLDPEIPFKANDVKVEDSQSIAIISNQKNLELAKGLAKDKLPIINIDEIQDVNNNIETIYVSPDTPTYLLYTTGTTGLPKGIMQIHRNVLNFIRNYTNTAYIGAEDRITLLASYSFSAALMDIMGALVNGARVVSWNVRMDGFEGMSQWLLDEGITIFHSTPTVLRHFTKTLKTTDEFRDLRLLYIAGEVSTRRDFEVYKQYFSKNSVMISALGSSELAIISQFFSNKDTEITGNYVPLGKPTENTEMMLLDDNGKEVKLGEIGEIVIKCPYLAIGYWNKPEKNEQQFKTTEDGNRLYFSMDLARLRCDGSIEYTGRKDTQINLRGYSVTLGELEVLIGRHPDVQEAVVIASEDMHEDMCMVAYIELKKGRFPVAREIREYLRTSLPEVMIPSYFIHMDEMPITSNGKIDRNKLPKPENYKKRIEVQEQEPYVAPRDLYEEKLSEIWAQMLRFDKVGIHDNFFDLGGTSLVAMELVIKVNQIFNAKIPYGKLLKAPNIASMSEILKKSFENIEF